MRISSNLLKRGWAGKGRDYDMAQSNRLELKLHRFKDAWAKIAPEESLAGMTLAEFVQATQPSLTAREEAAEAVMLRRMAIADRDKADDDTRALMRKVAGSVIGSPLHGVNSALYRAMGYRTDNEKASGLTRKSQTAEEVESSPSITNIGSDQAQVA